MAPLALAVSFVGILFFTSCVFQGLNGGRQSNARDCRQDKKARASAIRRGIPSPVSPSVPHLLLPGHPHSYYRAHASC